MADQERLVQGLTKSVHVDGLANSQRIICLYQTIANDT